VAVIGPMATEGAIGGGGSSFLQPPYRVTPLQALQKSLAGKVELAYAEGCDSYDQLPVIKPFLLQPSKGGGNGLRGEYFANTDFAGPALLDRVDERMDFWFMSFAPLEETPKAYSVRWTGKLSPQTSGRHTLRVQNTGLLRLYLDGKQLLENGSLESSFHWSGPEAETLLELEKGKSYDLKLEFVRPAEVRVPNVRVSFGYTPRPEDDTRMAEAIALAKEADVALVFVGWPEGHESEGYDRPGIGLTNRQDELVQAVATANSKTVVVLNCGSPVAMPWVDQVPAILEAYYPGQENGNAVTSLLLGEANPSGKLTVTFPRRIEHTPAYTNFGPGRSVLYGEGIFVGYRHYDQRQIEPLFPFGHGLSYTNFAYRDLDIQMEPGPSGETPRAHVSLVVENTGQRQGAEVVQLYVSDRNASQPRPPKELKGFARVDLKPGESKPVNFELDERAFSFFDPVKTEWVVEPGEFEVLVGASAADIRLRGTLRI
jgi:beta-glucosidase